MFKTNRWGVVGSAVALAVAVLSLGGRAYANQQIVQVPLPGADIPKYQDPMPTFTGGTRVEARPPGRRSYTVGMEEFQQQVLPASVYPSTFASGTWVWGYQVDDRPAHYPGFTVEVERGVPVMAMYLNHLGRRLPDGTFAPPVLQPYLTVDQTLHWADPLRLHCAFLPPPQAAAAGCLTPYGYPSWPGFPVAHPQPTGAPVPAIAHLHGGENPSTVDGNPEAWFTPNGWRQRHPDSGALGPPQSALTGPAYFSAHPVAGGASFIYPNGQEAAAIWFHDHAFGTDRLNVWGGLAAFYIVRDRFDTGRADNPIRLPADPFEIEIAIQDRLFDTNGQLIYPDVGVNPSLCGAGGPSSPAASPMCHPFWVPEAFGDAIVVNGKTWPFLEVEPRRYRFRLLGGSNARFYDLAFSADSGPAPDLWVIGTDGGLLDAPARIAPPARLLIAPGERYDVIVDFSRLAGRTLTLTNDAAAPFPTGDAADPATTGQIAQFRVVKPLSAPDRTCDPAASPKPWHGGGFGGDEADADDAWGDGDDHRAGKGARGTGCRLRGGRDREPRIVRLADPEAGVLADGVHPALRRQLVLREVTGPDGAPVEVLLNNTRFSGLRESTLTVNPTRIPDSFPSPYTTGDPGDANHEWATELARVGSTELWEVINLTTDAHPIHLHLVQFQLVNRQAFDPAYVTAWEAAFPGGDFLPGEGSPYRYLNENNPTIPRHSRIVGGNPFVDPFLSGPAEPPEPQEAGWKDTVVMPPGTVTRLAVRFAPQDAAIHEGRAGRNLFPFDPTRGPGYVWHCHILEHEENDMMRPLLISR
jgi:FtsP/CotA-like multicopper oxidase with cupredoxin domain